MIPQDHIQPKISQRVFQPLPFLGFALQIEQGEPSLRPLALPTIIRRKTLLSFQLLHANLCM